VLLLLPLLLWPLHTRHTAGVPVAGGRHLPRAAVCSAHRLQPHEIRVGHILWLMHMRPLQELMASYMSVEHVMNGPSNQKTANFTLVKL
jgi:hypothetical protein